MTAHAYEWCLPKNWTLVFGFPSALPTTCGHIPTNTTGLRHNNRRQHVVATKSSEQWCCNPPLPTPSAGRPRILNIIKIVYIKSWGILIMLPFRGAINVGTVLGARNREQWRFDFIGNPPADVGAWSTRPMNESRSTTDADEADNCLDNLKKSKKYCH